MAHYGIRGEEITQRQLPTGDLHPLPVPLRAWSHIAVHFVTNLPPSEGNTVIRVVVEQFSKSCRFIPLPFPTVVQTTQALLTHVLCPYDQLEDILSDQ